MRSKEIHIYLYVLYIYSVICIVMGCCCVNALTAQQQQQSVIIAGGPHGKARYKTMYACEDRQLVMDCDFGSKINLIRANYGRFSITQCNEQGQLDMSTDCMSPLTFRIMRERCQDKQKCSVNATSSIFGDKCPKTRKYLEVHFQCQPDPQASSQPSNVTPINNGLSEPDRVDLRVIGNGGLAAPQQPSSQGFFASTNGQSPVLPPNNPINMAHQQQQQQQQQSMYRPRPDQLESQPVASASGQPAWLNQQQQQQQPPQQQQHQPLMTVMNSEIITYKPESYQLNEPITATLRHIHTDNMSNPRCVLWDIKSQQWVPRGATVNFTNATHTTCAFDQPGSYMLVMDYLNPSQVNYKSQEQQETQQQPQQQQQSNTDGHQMISTPIVTKPNVPPLGPIIPNLFENQPIQLVSPETLINPANNTPNNNYNNNNISVSKSHQQALNESTVVRFFSLFGYLFAFIFIVVALGTIAFIASTMRSSAGAALKSLGNFAAFSSAKYKNGRRSDPSNSGGPLHNKDLLVINNQNGHQFLYAPANTTKINSSASTHILSTGIQAGTLHQFNQQQQLNAHQQPMYSANGTLSNLSGTGGQSNNYYYGLMGLTPLFQQQSQMQHHLSQHHLSNHQQQQQQQQQQQPQHHQQASYHQQANKSTVSNESANSTPSSSGVESGSTSVHHHNQQQPQQQQTCLMMNSDYNLIGHQLTNYGQAPFQQPTLTNNAHYGMATGNNNLNQRQLASLAGGNAMREHIYECVDDDKTYTARLLFPTNLNNPPSDPFNSNTLSHNNHQQQQMNQSRALTLSSRLIQNQANQQQQQQNNSNTNKRLISHPAIIRDNQAKTNIICSKLVQVTPQRATEISNKFQQDIMAIYNPNDTTTTTANSSTSGNSSSCYSRAESVGGGLNAKLRTDC